MTDNTFSVSIVKSVIADGDLAAVSIVASDNARPIFIDWGDDTGWQEVDGAEASHQYEQTGNYQILVKGNIAGETIVGTEIHEELKGRDGPNQHPASSIVCGDARTVQEYFDDLATINVTMQSAIDGKAKLQHGHLVSEVEDLSEILSEKLDRTKIDSYRTAKDQDAIDLQKAPLADPNFTGSASVDNKKIATEEWVDTKNFQQKPTTGAIAFAPFPLDGYAPLNKFVELSKATDAAIYHHLLTHCPNFVREIPERPHLFGFNL